MASLRTDVLADNSVTQAPVTQSLAIAVGKQQLTLAPKPDTDSCTTRECIRKMIVHYASKYGVSPDLAVSVAECESHLRTNVYGDHGLAYGVFQFHEETFDLFAAEEFPAETLDYHDPEDAIKLAIVSIAHGRGDHWTCYRWATR